MLVWSTKEFEFEFVLFSDTWSQGESFCELNIYIAYIKCTKDWPG